MSERVNKPKRSAVLIDMGLLEYRRAIDLQIQTLQSKINQTIFAYHPKTLEKASSPLNPQYFSQLNPQGRNT